MQPSTFVAYSPFLKATIPSVLDNLRAITDNTTMAMGLRRLKEMLEGDEGTKHLEDLFSISPSLREIWLIWDKQVTGSDHEVSAALCAALTCILEHPRTIQTESRTQSDHIVQSADTIATELVTKKLRALQFHAGSGDKARVNYALALMRAVAVRSPGHARRLAKSVDWKHASFAKAAKYTLAKDSQATDVAAAYTQSDIGQRIPRANLILLVLTILQSTDAPTLENLIAGGIFTALILGDLASDPRGIVIDILTVLQTCVLHNTQLPAWCKAAVFTDRNLLQLAQTAADFHPRESKEKMEVDGEEEDPVLVSEVCRSILIEALSSPGLGLAPSTDRHMLFQLQPQGAPQLCSLGGHAPLRVLLTQTASSSSEPSQASAAPAARVGPNLRGYLDALSSTEESSAAGPRRITRVLEKLSPLTSSIHADVLMTVLAARPILALAYLQALPFPLDHGANDGEKTRAAAELTARIVDVCSCSAHVAWGDYVTMSTEAEGVVVECDVKAVLSRLVPAPLTRPLLTRMLLSKTKEARVGALVVLRAVLHSAAHAVTRLTAAAQEKLASMDTSLDATHVVRLQRALATAIESKLRPRVPDVQSVISCFTAAYDHVAAHKKTDADVDGVIGVAAHADEAEASMLCLAACCAALPTSISDAHYDPLRFYTSAAWTERVPEGVKRAAGVLAAAHAAIPNLSMAATLHPQGIAALLTLSATSSHAAAAATARLASSGALNSCVTTSTTEPSLRATETSLWTTSYENVAAVSTAQEAEFLATFVADVAVQTLKRPQELYGFVQSAAETRGTALGAVDIDFSLFALCALRQGLKICASKSVQADSKFTLACYLSLCLRLLRSAQPASSLLPASLQAVASAELNAKSSNTNKKAKTEGAEAPAVPLPAPLDLLLQELEVNPLPGGATVTPSAVSSAVLSHVGKKSGGLAAVVAAAVSGLLPPADTLESLMPAKALDKVLKGETPSSKSPKTPAASTWLPLAACVTHVDCTDAKVAARYAGAAASALSASFEGLDASLSPLHAASASYLLAKCAVALPSWKTSLLTAIPRVLSSSMPALAASISAALLAVSSSVSSSSAPAATNKTPSSKKRKAEDTSSSAPQDASYTVADHAACLNVAVDVYASARLAPETTALQSGLLHTLQTLLAAVHTSPHAMHQAAQILATRPPVDASLAETLHAAVSSVLQDEESVKDRLHVTFVLSALVALPTTTYTTLLPSFLEALEALPAETAGLALVGSETHLRALLARAPAAQHAAHVVSACLAAAPHVHVHAGTKAAVGVSPSASSLLCMLVGSTPAAHAAYVRHVGSMLSVLKEADRRMFRESLAQLLPVTATALLQGGSEGASTLAASFTEPLVAYFGCKPTVAAKSPLSEASARCMESHGPAVLANLLRYNASAAVDALQRICVAEVWSALQSTDTSCSYRERVAAVLQVLQCVVAAEERTAAQVLTAVQAVVTVAAAVAENKSFAESEEVARESLAKLIQAAAEALPCLPASPAPPSLYESLASTLSTLTTSSLKRHLMHPAVLTATNALWDAMIKLSTGTLAVTSPVAPTSTTAPPPAAKHVKKEESGSSDSSDSDSSSDDSSDSDEDQDGGKSGRVPIAALRTTLANMCTDLAPLIPSHSKFGPLLASAAASSPTAAPQAQAAAIVSLFARLCAFVAKRSAVNPFVSSLLPVLLLLHNATSSPFDCALRHAINALQPTAASNCGYAFGPFATALKERDIDLLAPDTASVDDIATALSSASPLRLPLLQGAASAGPTDAPLGYDVAWLTQFVARGLEQGTLQAAYVVSSGLFAVPLRALGWPEVEVRSAAYVAVERVIRDYTKVFFARKAEDAARRHKSNVAFNRDTSTKKTIKKGEKDTRPAIFLLFDFLDKSKALKNDAKPRLPNIVTTFLAHASLCLVFGDDSPLFGPTRSLLPRKSLERYLRRKQEMDATDVPMLYALLAGGTKDQKTDRIAACRFLRVALQDASDVEASRRRYALELVTALVGCAAVCQPAVALAGLTAVCDVVGRVPAVVSDLAGRIGLVPWMATQASDLIDVHVAGGIGRSDSVASALATDVVKRLADVVVTTARTQRALLASVTHAHTLIQGKVHSGEVPDGLQKELERLARVLH